ncbi:MAG: hypothetical protein RR356_06480 [Bacteroidales bacterium]
MDIEFEGLIMATLVIENGENLSLNGFACSMKVTKKETDKTSEHHCVSASILHPIE